MKATVTPPDGRSLAGRYVRVELPGKGKFLSLAEVQVMRGGENLARSGVATQSSTDYDGPAAKAIDGNTDGRYVEAKSTTHTAATDDPWWEVDLKAEGPIDGLSIWNRVDGGLQRTRLANFRVVILNDKHEPVWSQAVSAAPNPSVSLATGGPREIRFAAAIADYAQPGFDAASILDNKDPADRGWAVGGQPGVPHTLALIPATPVEKIEPGSTLTLTIEQLYKKIPNHSLGRFRVATSEDDHASETARTPANLLAILSTPGDKRSDAQKAELSRHYRESVSPELKPARDRLAVLKTQLSGLKPTTTVPVLRDLAGNARRTTKLQHRGNFMDLGQVVAEGVPAVFPPLPTGVKPDRLALARWLVSDENPLTARVIANRYWDGLFGIGLVPTSEEFGTQGDLPSHPELLDWLAVELVASKWDLKAFLKLLGHVRRVPAAVGRHARDAAGPRPGESPGRRRGPRFRLSAETIRDQALFAGGLLEPRRCTGRRLSRRNRRSACRRRSAPASIGRPAKARTATAARSIRCGGVRIPTRRWPRSTRRTARSAPCADRARTRRCKRSSRSTIPSTSRPPRPWPAAWRAAARPPPTRPVSASASAWDGTRSEDEVRRLVALYDASFAELSRDRDRATKLATEPIGPAPKDADVADLAAWTVVGNVLLNLDETLMKR